MSEDARGGGRFFFEERVVFWVSGVSELSCTLVGAFWNSWGSKLLSFWYIVEV